MKKATTLEAAQEIYDEITSDIYGVAKVDSTDKAEVDKFEGEVAEVVESRKNAQKDVTDLLNKYLEVLKTMDEYKDKTTLIEELVANAKNSVNNSKTAAEVDDAKDAFENLLLAGGYKDLYDEVNRQNRILKAQEDAYKILDAYEANLDVITNASDKTQAKAEITRVRALVKNAKEPEEIGVVTKKAMPLAGTILRDFVDFMDGHYKAMTKPAAKKLIEDALAEALETLETYKTGAYANEVVNPNAAKEDQKTIADLVKEYTEELQETATELLVNPVTNEYKEIEDYLYNETTGKVTLLDAEIKAIQKAIENDREAYVEAYQAAMEELEVYAENAKVFNLTSEQLEYINSLISNTQGIIKEVNTAPDVTLAMTAFRGAVAEYYSDFDQYQVEEIKKLAVAKLEEYNDLSTDIDASVTKGVAAVKSQTTVNGIQTELQKALDEINEKIKSNATAQAKVEARAKFYEYLETEDEDSEYSNEVHNIAKDAVDAINDATSVREVNNAVTRYQKLLEEQLEKDGVKLKEKIAKLQEEAKKEIALYKELVAGDEDLLALIGTYEAGILSEDATPKSIENDLAAIRDHIETLENELIKAKVKAINYIKDIGNSYYLSTTSIYTENVKYLKDYCSKTNNELSYDLLTNEETGDAYVRRAFEKAITAIKNATKVDDLTLTLSAGKYIIPNENAFLLKQRGIVIEAVNALSAMKKEAEANKVAIIKHVGTEFDISAFTNASDLSVLDTDDYYVSVTPEVKEFIKGVFSDYFGRIDKVQCTENAQDYKDAFAEIVKQAKNTIDHYIKEKISEEAEANLNVSNMNTVLKDILTSGNMAYGKDVTDLQTNISVTPASNGVGIVKGDIRLTTSYTEYSSANPKGYFITLAIKSDTAKSIIVRRYEDNSDKATVEKDMGEDEFLTVRFADKDAIKTTKVVVEFYDKEGLTATTSKDETPAKTITYDFSNLTLHDDYAEFKAVPVK